VLYWDSERLRQSIGSKYLEVQAAKGLELVCNYLNRGLLDYIIVDLPVEAKTAVL
jgi:hypothetical protein